MRRSVLVVLPCIIALALTGCATARVVPGPLPKGSREVRFAKGVLRTVAPGPEWSFSDGRGAVIVDAQTGERTRPDFLLQHGESAIVGFVYDSAKGTPLSIARKLRDEMRGSAQILDPGIFAYGIELKLDSKHFFAEESIEGLEKLAAQEPPEGSPELPRKVLVSLDHAGFRFTDGQAAPLRKGKIVVAKLNDVMSVWLIGTWLTAADGEASFDAVVSGLGIVPLDQRK